MIIEGITLHNFGVFRGEHKVILRPPSSAKPVVLFGGLNGAGKTTLMEAMQLALYGRSASSGRKSDLGYEEYLRRLIHRQSNPKDGAAVEAVLRVNEEGTSREIRVRRTWAVGGARVNERLEVFRDGELDQHLADTWLDYVGRLMPPQLSELFFFDGERIESLADPGQSLEILRSAVHALLGVDLVNQLHADLLVLNRRKLIERRPGPEKVRLEAIEKEVHELATKLQDQKQYRAQLQRDVDYAAKKLTELNERFAREGGVLAENRASLESAHVELKRQKVQAEDELRKLGGTSLPLAIVSQTLLTIQAQAAAESADQQTIVARKLAEERDARLMEHLRSELSDPKVIKRVVMLLAKDRDTYLKAPEGQPYLRMSEEARRQLDVLCKHSLAEVVGRAKALTGEVVRINLLLDDTDRRLASIPDAEAIAKLVGERDAARSRREMLDAQLRAVDADASVMARELEVRERDLQRLNEELHAAEVGGEESNRFIRFAERGRDTLERFRMALTKRHAAGLADKIRTAFQKLLRKQRLVNDLKIDPDNCRLTLFDIEGREIPSERLSAGERQLLAVSILWGLGQAAGRPLPVIIDTPLGRLDTKHRMHLVQRYFPFASHQVILLSTDEEITDQYLTALKPKIGRSYRLVHDDAAGSSSIEDGYFEEVGTC